MHLSKAAACHLILPLFQFALCSRSPTLSFQPLLAHLPCMQLAAHASSAVPSLPMQHRVQSPHSGWESGPASAVLLTGLPAGIVLVETIALAHGLASRLTAAVAEDFCMPTVLPERTKNFGNMYSRCTGELSLQQVAGHDEGESSCWQVVPACGQHATTNTAAALQLATLPDGCHGGAPCNSLFFTLPAEIAVAVTGF